MSICTQKSIASRQLFFKIAVLFVALFACLPMSAQRDRSYIRNAIKGWGECRNVAITRTNGDVALYSTNGCARSNVPSSLNNALSELNKNGSYIDDVELTENGSWLIIYNNNGLRWNNIPRSLERKLKEYNEKGEVITSATFNDNGEWIVITTEHISASDSVIQDWLAEGLDKHGMLWAACITDDCLIAVFERGYKFFGNVPDGLSNALDNTSIDVYRIKVAGDSWFFADKEGHFHYNM